ncbi:hypothetical protein [Providencia hangzhouensis]|uniref:hypothetical protein n=1 Tax=Providencia hangzhouensis TaxID=3031799 RepID=UPI0034DD671F
MKLLKNNVFSNGEKSIAPITTNSNKKEKSPGYPLLKHKPPFKLSIIYTYKTHYVKRASLLLKTARLTPSERLSAILSTKHTP